MAAGNKSLWDAKKAKNDEFYTRYVDIEAEMNAYVEFNPDVFRDKTILLPCDDPEWSNFTRYFAANFERFGIKKLISTSYAKGVANKQLTLFESESPLFDESMHEDHGRLFTLTRDKTGNGRIDGDDIEFDGYLEGDGDFRSPEVCKLRDEADIIITNPPFSLFRVFVEWILSAKKQFVIIGNQNVPTLKNFFPLLRDGVMWHGPEFPGGDAFFDVPDDADVSGYADGVYNPDTKQVHFRNCRWYTNLDFGERHKPVILDSMQHNLKFNKKLRTKLLKDHGSIEYPHYANIDAIEVPLSECIPSDYAGIMGVPVTFLERCSPDQFDVLALSSGSFSLELGAIPYTELLTGHDLEIIKAKRPNKGAIIYYNADGVPALIYKRLFIRYTESWKASHPEVFGNESDAR